ncbi:unnamed protein product [Trichobilharzia szidati]|nr:unnamed protein product [Trichobilharzia szidati]
MIFVHCFYSLLCQISKEEVSDLFSQSLSNGHCTAFSFPHVTKLSVVTRKERKFSINFTHDPDEECEWVSSYAVCCSCSCSYRCSCWR